VKAGPTLAVALVALAAAGPAAADTSSVQIVDTAYNPERVIVLAGDTVGWRNSSFINQHTVTAPGFDSGPIVPAGGFYRDFTAPGTYLYTCTIHPIMSGEVDVYGLLLNAPGKAVARGAATALTGRAEAGIQKTVIEEDTGTGFRPVANADVEVGKFRAIVHPPANASYRAVSGADSSPTVQVAVSDRSDVRLTASGRRLRVHVDPGNPGARVSLQFKLRERFGWWTVARRRLDEHSDALFTIQRRKPVWARVVLTQRDGWTVLAASAVLRLRPSATERSGRRPRRPSDR
jgi:plastocyanin